MLTPNEQQVIFLAANINPPPENAEELSQIVSDILAFSPQLRNPSTILVDIKYKIYNTDFNTLMKSVEPQNGIIT